MSEQIFISYRRSGGDVSAKLICEALKNQGYTVFYDYDSLRGGYFDSRILNAIEGCSDFVLVLPKDGLDRCVNQDDWVRQEIVCALSHHKNVIPVMLPDFSFPKDLPQEIASISRINGVPFSMPFFDAMIQAIRERLSAHPQQDSRQPQEQDPETSEKSFLFEPDEDGGFGVRYIGTEETAVVIPESHKGLPVTSICPQAFAENKKLKKVLVPPSVKTIGKEAFLNCIALEELRLHKGLLTIGDFAFKGCTALERVVVPEGVTSIGQGAFLYCNFLNEIELPSTISAISCDMLAVTALYRIKIPHGVKSIELGAFSQCRTLETVIMADSVETIVCNAFRDCTSLKTVRFGNSMKFIDFWAFKGCSSLKQITLPRSIKHIGAEAFAKCPPFMKVDYYGGSLGWKYVEKESNSFPLFTRIKSF